MIPARFLKATDAVHEQAASEVIQEPCESGGTCLTLSEDGCTVDTLWLSDDMLEVFINLEACYRQQGISDSALHAFRQLAGANVASH